MLPGFDQLAIVANDAGYVATAATHRLDVHFVVGGAGAMLAIGGDQGIARYGHGPDHQRAGQWTETGIGDDGGERPGAYL